jgi:hypothetical protein
MYALYLYFPGLSFRNISSKAMQPFGEEGRSYVATWKWVQRFNQSILNVFTVAREYLLF